MLDNGAAYVGDLAMNIFRLISKKLLPIEAENFQHVKESIKKLVYFGAEEFFPSHGRPINKKLIECMIK